MSGIWPIKKLCLQEHLTWQDLTYRTSTVLIWQPEGRNQAFSSISSQHCFPPVYQLLHCDGARAEQGGTVPGGILQVWVLVTIPFTLRQWQAVLHLSHQHPHFVEQLYCPYGEEQVSRVWSTCSSHSSSIRYIPWTDGRSQLADPDSCKK